MKLSPPCQEIRESKISLYILVTAGENNSYKTFFLFEESLIKISRTSEKILAVVVTGVKIKAFFKSQWQWNFNFTLAAVVVREDVQI